MLAVTSFDGLFQYMLPGTEGSVHDAGVLQKALLRGLKVPARRYYLVDPGFSIRPGFMAPFGGITYHIQDFRLAARQPRDAKEYYNFRHSQLRTTVEHVFGRCKRKWKIIRTSAPESTFSRQVEFVYAVTGLYNFITMRGMTPEKIIADDFAGLDVDELEALRLVGERADRVIGSVTMLTLRELI
jgi:hypothetical protein